jgi:hypothetical protein
MDDPWSWALAFGAVLCWLFALFVAFAKPSKEPWLPFLLWPSNFKAVFGAVRPRWLVVMGVGFALAALLR